MVHPLFLLLVSTLLFASTAPAQTDEPETTKPASRVVESVEFRGACKFAECVLLERIKTKPGAKYRERQAGRDLRNLVEFGGFSEEYSTVGTNENDSGRIAVVFNLAEQPVIGKIHWFGVRSDLVPKFHAACAGRNISLEPGAPFDESLPDALQTILFDLMFPQITSRDDIRVDEIVDWTVSPPQVAIRIEPDSVLQKPVKEVRLEGGDEITDKELLEKTARFRESSSDDEYPDGFSTARLEDDINEISPLFRRKGYLDFLFTGWEFTEAEESCSVRIQIEPGTRFRIEEIRGVGSSVLSSDEIVRISGLKSGDWANGFSAEDVSERIRQAYAQRNLKEPDSVGVDFLAEPVSPGQTDGKAKVTILVCEKNSPSRVRFVEFVGNEVTLDTIIRRQVRSVEGTPFDPELLNLDVERIKNLGLFEDVRIEDVQFDEKTKEADIIIRVTEKRCR